MNEHDTSLYTAFAALLFIFLAVLLLMNWFLVAFRQMFFSDPLLYLSVAIPTIVLDAVFLKVFFPVIRGAD